MIVAFDNTVTSKRAVNINNDQFQMGKKWAEFLAEQTKGKGTVLMVRGLAGTPVDNQQASGAKSVFEKYPGLKIVEVYGNWDVGATQKAVANALASTPQIDGVWGTAACTGTIQAFLQSSRPLVPMTGECDNGFMRLVAEKKVPALVIGQPLPWWRSLSVQRLPCFKESSCQRKSAFLWKKYDRENGGRPEFLPSATRRFCDGHQHTIVRHQYLAFGIRKVAQVFNAALVLRLRSMSEMYARVGKDVVHRLRGMFAFAIWDTWTRELFCAGISSGSSRSTTRSTRPRRRHRTGPGRPPGQQGWSGGAAEQPGWPAGPLFAAGLAWRRDAATGVAWRAGRAGTLAWWHG